MEHRNLFAILAVSLLVLTAGCSAITNQTEPTSTEEKIEQSMKSIDTVEVRQQAFRNITVQNDQSQISQTTDYRVASKYSLENESYLELTQTREKFLQNEVMQQSERYYINGTMYYRSANSLQNNTSNPEWQVEDREVNVTEPLLVFADADLLEHYEPVETDNNSTLKYQIDLLSNDSHVEKKLNGTGVSDFDRVRPFLEVYELEIRVDAETHRLQNVRIAAFGQLNQSQLSQLDDIYRSVEGDEPSGALTYAVEYKFSGYNTNVTIQPPEVEDE